MNGIASYLDPPTKKGTPQDEWIPFLSNLWSDSLGEEGFFCFHVSWETKETGETRNKGDNPGSTQCPKLSVAVSTLEMIQEHLIFLGEGRLLVLQIQLCSSQCFFTPLPHQRFRIKYPLNVFDSDCPKPCHPSNDSETICRYSSCTLIAWHIFCYCIL